MLTFNPTSIMGPEAKSVTNHWPKAKNTYTISHKHTSNNTKHTTALYRSNIGMLEFLAFVSV